VEKQQIPILSVFGLTRLGLKHGELLKNCNSETELIIQS